MGLYEDLLAEGATFAFFAGGRHLTAGEALRYGLVQEVVPHNELPTVAARWCDDVANVPAHPMATQRALSLARISGAPTDRSTTGSARGTTCVPHPAAVKVRLYMGDEVVHDNIRLVLESFHAVRLRDGPRLTRLYHPNIEFHDPPSLPYGGVVRGKRAVEAHMYGARGWARTWVPLQPTDAERAMDPRVVAATEREVVVLFRQRAVGPGGERFDSPVVGLYEVCDGKLVRAQMFHFDTAALVAFLGRANAAGS